MSLGTNLQFLRKRQNLTQEEFAEKLDVSRQTVSKWESDLSYPEMEKLLQLCDQFGCDLDTLTRGSAPDSLAEDSAGYDREMNTFTWAICVGVALTLVGIAVASLMLGRGMNEILAMMALLAFMVVAAAIFILYSLRHGAFVKKHPQIRPFYRPEQVDAFDRRFPFFIALPTVLILLGVIALLGLQAFPRPDLADQETFEYYSVAAFLLLLALSAPLYVYGGMQKYKYNIAEYNETNAPTEENRRVARLTGTACGAIMLLTTLCYLVLGLGYDRWDSAGVVYAVGGLLCGVASVVVSGVVRKGKG